MKLRTFINEYGTTVLLGGHKVELKRQFNCVEEVELHRYEAEEKMCCGRSYDDWKLNEEGTIKKQFPNVTALAELVETNHYSSINEGYETKKYYKNEYSTWVEISKKAFEKLFKRYMG